MDIVPDITRLLFIESELKNADMIMVPGSDRAELPEYAAVLYKRGLAPLILIGGAYSVKQGFFPGPKSGQDRYPGPYKTECAFYADVLAKNGVPPSAVIGEARSMYTKQNADFASELTRQQGMRLRRAILVCKPYHARRCTMYYQLAFPGVELITAPVPGLTPNKESWLRSEKDAKCVLGELARIAAQFTRRDLAALQSGGMEEGEPWGPSS